MNKPTFYKFFLNVFLCFFVILFFVALYHLCQTIYYEEKNKKIEEIVLKQVDTINMDQITESYFSFERLKEINEDIVGWILIPDTHINYAIVQGKDNSFYLSHDLFKEYNIYGSIFLNYENQSDFSDANSILFGHNTYKESMFSEIVKIYEGNYGNDITIYLFIPGQILEYQVYSSYLTVDTDSAPLSISNSYFSKSDVLFPSISHVTKTLTISTCYKNDERRVILHAMQK